VAVYSWHHTINKNYANVREDEYTDEQLQREGFAEKHLQFYALTRRSQNTAAVYRWLLPKKHFWIVIPDNEDTYKYIKAGYRIKLFNIMPLQINKSESLRPKLKAAFHS
jgi:hypothetical protein